MKHSLATQQIEAGRLDEAVITLRQAIELHPENQTFYRLFALCKMEQGDLSAATAAAARAASLGDESSDLSYIRGMIAEQQRRLEDAHVHYQRAAFLAPQNSDCFMAEVESLVALDRPVLAKQLIDERMGDFDEDSHLLLVRASLGGLLGDWEQVARDYGLLTATMPDSNWVSEQYGLVLTKLQRYEEALGVLLPMLDREFDSEVDHDAPPSVVRAAATCYLRLDQPHHVPSLLNDYLSRNPSDARAWWLLAEASARVSDWAAVRRCVRSGRRLNPHRLEWKLLQAYLSFSRGNTAEATEILEAALRQHPNNTPVLSFLGDIRNDRGVADTDAVVEPAAGN